MQKLYIFVGCGKDENGECRAAIADVVAKSGGALTENVAEATVIAALGGDGTICAVCPKINFGKAFEGVWGHFSRKEPPQKPLYIN